jgi:hypothetical protein
MSDQKVNMKITVEVTGKEGFKQTTEYQGTTLETVRKVQNKLLEAGIALNNES